MLGKRTALSETRQGRLLEELLKQRGFNPGYYALFFTSEEGTLLPISTPDGEVEELSGYLVDRSGNHYLFWLGWDAEREAPALTRWNDVQAQVHWRDNEEYRSARKEVGLPIP